MLYMYYVGKVGILYTPYLKNVLRTLYMYYVGKVGILYTPYLKNVLRTLYMYYVGKCKPIPLEAWTGPEGSRRLRLPDFKTIGT